ncbi:MAG: TonB-dependent receptor [Marinilabiliales bacterium]|nr:MAG: TonB-dependent receptor [Marinilabiliales bacterium]
MFYASRSFTVFIILLLSFSLPVTGLLFGQQPGSGPSPRGVISGTVVESVSHQPLEYVNVIVYPRGGNEVVTGGITAADGTFRIDGIPRGKYDISVSFIGFETSLIGEVNVDPASAETHLGTIELTPGEEMMEEVTVTAEREMLRLNLDKMVFTVDRDMTATGGSALDIMESIPSVSVDYDGRISLRGNTNVTIWVDGRPSHLESLDQLPATMIERVEVITNPSARHDPDGTSGIINVIMKRQRQPGTNGMLSFNMGTGNKYNGSVHMNHRADRFNFFGNWDYRRHGMEGYNLNDRNIITGQGDTLRQLHQHEDFFRRGVFNNFRLGTDFFISPGNTLTFYGAFNLRDTRPQNFSEVNLFLPSSQDLYTTMERQFNGFGREYVLNYTRNGGDNGRQFTADLFYSASTGETFRDIRVDESADPGASEIRYAEAYTPGRLLTLQADYVHPFNEQSRLEAGAKSIFRDVEDDFNFYDVDAETGEHVTNTDFTNYFIYSEAIHAIYGIYAHSFNRLHLQAGLRAEQHTSEAEQRVTGQYSERSIPNIFPSAHIRYLVDDRNALYMSYSKRINRPGISMLNPFVNYSDPMNISFGNQDLRPEYIDSYEIGYQYSQNRKSFSAALFYRDTEDMISREMTLFGGANPQTRTTFQNLMRGISYGVEAVVNYPLFRWWRMNATGSYYYNKLEDDSLPDWEHSGDAWRVQAISNWNIANTVNLQARFNYQSSEVTAGRTIGGGCQQHGGQGILDAMYYLDLAARMDVMNGNGTISLRLSDVFKSRGFDMFTYGPSFTSDLVRRSQSRVLFVGFTWRFNEYRQRTEREREGSLLDELD